MVNLYHYCASWAVDDKVFMSSAVMKSKEAICFENYGDFVQLVRNNVKQEAITITSLTYLGQEAE